MLNKIFNAEVECQRCFFRTKESNEEIEHSIEHFLFDLDSTTLKTETKQIINLINQEFHLNNFEEAEEVIRNICKIMSEVADIKISNTFKIR